MALRKEDGADLRSKYWLFIQLGLFVSLLLVVLAVQIDFRSEQSFKVDLKKQETVEMKEIQQTKQETKPPPPPKPPVPVEVPNNETIEEEDVDFDSSLDLDESLDTGSGPPAPESEGEEEEEEDEIFVVVEQQPDCGGIKALQNKVEYPDFARKAGIEGRVFVQFVVNKQGQIVQPEVKRGVHKLLDQEALRAVKQLSCQPGMQRGEPVKVRMSLPVSFQLR